MKIHLGEQLGILPFLVRHNVTARLLEGWIYLYCHLNSCVVFKMLNKSSKNCISFYPFVQQFFLAFYPRICEDALHINPCFRSKNNFEKSKHDHFVMQNNDLLALFYENMRISNEAFTTLNKSYLYSIAPEHPIFCQNSLTIPCLWLARRRPAVLLSIFNILKESQFLNRLGFNRM